MVIKDNNYLFFTHKKFNIMKKLISITIILTVFLMGSFAQSVTEESSSLTKPDKVTTQKMLKKTQKFLDLTTTSVKAKKVYTGGLVRANKLQKEANTLFKKGHYAQAMKKSHLARGFGFVAYEANEKKAVPQSWKVKKVTVDKYIGKEIKVAELKKKITSAEKVKAKELYGKK